MLHAIEEGRVKLDIGGYVTNVYFASVPSKYELTDLFAPSFWKHCPFLMSRFMVRCRREDGAFDVTLTVASKTDDGAVVMELWPRFPRVDAVTSLDDLNPTTAGLDKMPVTKIALSKTDGDPVVRIEFLEATKWRLRGIDGQEVSRNHPNETKAKEALAKYVAQNNLVMPSADEIAAAKAEIEAKKAEREAKDKNKGKAA